MANSSTSSTSSTTKSYRLFGGGLLILICLVSLMLRNAGLYPTVFGDEYEYSLYSRLLPLSASPLPGYVYLAIYRLTNVCGDGFLQCARLFNVLFFLAAAPFIYATAARFCEKSVALTVVALTIVGPLNVYTAFFMPEPMYFFSFWVVTWYMLGLQPDARWTSWCIAGVLLGLSALVKPHSLLFVPALLVYAAYLLRSGKRGSWLVASLCFLFSVAVVKIGIGFLLAGRPGITFLGSFYSSIANGAAQGSTVVDRIAKYKNLVIPSIYLLKGHLEVVALLFAIPASVLLVNLFGLLKKGHRLGPDRVLMFTFIVMANLLCVTSLFTATVAVTDPHEATRLHMRYYNFALPLLYLVAANQFRTGTVSNVRERLCAALPISIVAFYVIITKLAPFTPNHIDGPEIRGVTANPQFFFATAVLSIATTMLWVIRPKAGARGFLFFLAPVLALVSLITVTRDLSVHQTPEATDLAGIFARNYIPRGDQGKVLVASSQLPDAYHILFYMGDSKASFVTIPFGKSYDAAKLPPDKDWLITVGDSPIVPPNFYQIRMQGFTLTRAIRDRTVKLTDRDWPGVIEQTTGLGEPEPWGRWSTAKLITIDFAAPLPLHAEIHLTANAFGPNIDKQFAVSIGTQTSMVKLGDGVAEHVLHIENPNRTNRLTIEVPNPVSPSQLHMNSDTRTIGLGLIQLDVR